MTDEKFLFPTLLSAIHARAAASPKKADVFIFVLEPCEESVNDFEMICRSENICFESISREAVGGLNGMYARFFLDRFVPSDYKDILYLDGDIQVHRSLDPLIDAPVLPGQFLASPDPMAILSQEEGAIGRKVRKYMEGLGLAKCEFPEYFNSGVLRINRSGWEDLGAAAYSFLRRRPDLCWRHDQSALNAVSVGRHKALSFKWNFPIFFKNCRVEQEIEPVIYHFMSSPKPWQGNFPPWSASAVTPYRDLLMKYNNLSKYAGSFPKWKVYKYFVQQRGKRVYEYLNWGLGARHSRIISMERLASKI